MKSITLFGFTITFSRARKMKKESGIQWPTLEKMPTNKPMPFFNKRTGRVGWL